MSAPTRPGCWRVLVPYSDGKPFRDGLGLKPPWESEFGGSEVWETVIVRWQRGAGTADFAGAPWSVSNVHPDRWGSRVEFPGDEPAKGPLTPDSVGWWWRWVDAVGLVDEGDWYPTRVDSDDATPPGLVYGYGAVKDDGRWGGRAVPPVTPAVEADEPAPEPEDDPPPGWTVLKYTDRWWCMTQAGQTPVTYRSATTRAGAIADAWECVRKRVAEAELAGDPEPMADEWWAALESIATGKPVSGVSELTARGFAEFEPDHGCWAPTREGLIALGRHLQGSPDDADATEGAREYDAFEWVGACPEGQRREQTLEDGAAIETRIVDRRDEP